MRKCEWRDGKFLPCDGFEPECLSWSEGVYLPYCSNCNRPYSKPEQNVIIKKSGGTWVARYDGVDYLCLSVFEEEPPFKPKHPAHMYLWQPFHKIEITDDIAKLRPMVMLYDDVAKLVSVEKEDWCSVITCNEVNSSLIVNTSLATVADL